MKHGQASSKLTGLRIFGGPRRRWREMSGEIRELNCRSGTSWEFCLNAMARARFNKSVGTRFDERVRALIELLGLTGKATDDS